MRLANSLVSQQARPQLSLRKLTPIWWIAHLVSGAVGLACAVGVYYLLTYAGLKIDNGIFWHSVLLLIALMGREVPFSAFERKFGVPRDGGPTDQRS